MSRAELLALAELEDRMADWLLEKSKGPPVIYSAYDASLVCANRAASLRALAEECGE